MRFLTDDERERLVKGALKLAYEHPNWGDQQFGEVWKEVGDMEWGSDALYTAALYAQKLKCLGKSRGEVEEILMRKP